MDLTLPLRVGAFALGASLFAVVMVDVFVTTISMHGGGPVTTRLMRVAHRLLSAPPPKPDEELAGQPVIAFFARYSNLLLTLSLFFSWVVLLIAGLWLMLLLDEGAVLRAADRAPADLAERLYFAGAAITTAGFGDYVPGDGGWQAYTVLMATSGLVVSSLGIAYVINIAGAAIQQRATARTIHNHGATPSALLAAGWDGDSFAGIEPALEQMAAGLITHTEHHLAYPLIHYVRTDDQRNSLPSNVAVLDEALTILLLEVPPDLRPRTALLVSARRAVTAYLESVDELYIEHESTDTEAPPWPDLAFLRDYWGIEPRRGFWSLPADAQRALARRRRLLRAAVRSQGRLWARTVEAAKGPDEGYDVNLYAATYGVPARGVRELTTLTRAQNN